jgi:hypothetical protein
VVEDWGLCADNISVGNPDRKRHMGKLNGKKLGNFDFRNIRYEDVGWIVFEDWCLLSHFH